MALSVVLFSWIATLFLSPQALATPGSYQVVRPGCDLYEKNGATWTKSSLTLPPRKIVRGEKSKSGRILVFKHDGRFFAIRHSCVRDSALTKHEDDQTFWLYPSFEILSWHEKLEISHSDGRKNDLRLNSIGICPGIAANKSWSRTSTSLELGLCFLFAQTNVGTPSDTASSGLYYTSRNSRSYGAKGDFRLLFRPETDGIMIGLDVPIFYRIGTWSTPSNGLVKISPNPALLYGIGAIARVESGAFILSTEIGHLIPVSGWLWAVQMGFKL